MQIHLPLTLALSGIALAEKCFNDNCARAVTGTRIPGQTAVARADCSNLVSATTVAGSTVTISVTAAVTTSFAKRAPSPFALPSYATACSSYAGYSSACSCFGITGGTVTAPAVTVTKTVATLTTTVSASPSACTADIKSDPLNCGKCGNVCESNVCNNGVCSSEVCNAQTCGGFTNCNPDNVNCFCFSAAEQTLDPDTNTVQNIGFCGQNAICADLTPCAKSTDCNVKGSSGTVCAVNTCCGEAGVCLQGLCSNPAQKLMMMARRGHLGTAAF